MREIWKKSKKELDKFISENVAPAEIVARKSVKLDGVSWHYVIIRDETRSLFPELTDHSGMTRETAEIEFCQAIMF